MPGVDQPDPPGLIHDDLRLLPPWRGSSLFWGTFIPLRVIAVVAERRSPFTQGTIRAQSRFHPQMVHQPSTIVGARVQSGAMSTSGGVLALVSDPGLRNDVDRVGAAVGVRVVHTSEPSSRKVWEVASAVVLDAETVCRCAELALPRRSRVFLVGHAEPQSKQWEAAIAVGVQRVLVLPDREDDLVAELSDAVQARRTDGRGAVLAVIGGRGGAGASVFATSLAFAAGNALLVDVDPWGGGLDLALGGEAEVGLRWPDLALQGGRVDYGALREALPARDGVTILSAGRGATEVDAVAFEAVLDAGRRGGATVVCDLPRRATPAVEAALDAADLVVLVSPADVRSCAAAAAMGRWLAASNPNVGLVVRGPSPGGLRPADVAQLVGLPTLAAMRAQPGVASMLERGGLNLRRRSPLASAARRVLAVLHQQAGDVGVLGAA
jgi:secretion/DNA translocation related CpaE-like protein